MGQIRRIRQMRGFHRLIIGTLWGLFFCLLLSMLVGCKTKYVSVPEYHTEYKTRIDSVLKRDSVWIHDSVSMWVKNDTVYKDRWHTEWRYHNIDKIRQDTTLKVDSVRIPYPVEKVVYKSKKEERVLWIFIILVMAGVMIGGKIAKRVV